MFDKDDDEDDRNDEGGGDSADEGQGQDGAAPGGGAGDSGDSGDGGGPPGGEDASAPDEGDEDEGPRLKKGSRVRWEAAGEGVVREVEQRCGEDVAIVAAGGWYWNSAANYFTTEENGAPGVPIRLADLQLAEAPKTPEERLERVQAMTKRLMGIARDASLAMEILKTETIGPGAHDALIAYHGGDRDAAGHTVRSFRMAIEEAIKDAKTGAKAMKALADAGDFIDESLQVAYQDLLMGTERQTTIDDVEGGRHKGGGKKRKKGPKGGGGAPDLPTEAPAPAPPAPGGGAKLIPWGQLRAWGPSGVPVSPGAALRAPRDIPGINEKLLAQVEEQVLGTTRALGLEDVGEWIGWDVRESLTYSRLTADELPGALVRDLLSADSSKPVTLTKAELAAFAVSVRRGLGGEGAAQEGPATGKPIEGEALTSFLKGWRAGADQLGLLVPYDRVGEDGMCEVVIDFEWRRIAADKVALVVEQLVKRDGGGTEDVERIVICTPEIVDWSGFPGEPEQAAAPGPLTAAQREEAVKRGVTPEQIASLEAALRADPEVSQVQLSKITGIERTRLQRILRAGQEG